MSKSGGGGGTDPWFHLLALDFEVWCSKHPSLLGLHKERVQKQTAADRTPVSLKTCVL